MAAIECKTYSSNAHIPKKAYQGSTGCDLYVAETKVLKPWGKVFIKLNISIDIPEGYYGRIVRPSGLVNTGGIIVHDETIDLDYRDVTWVVLFNLSK